MPFLPVVGTLIYNGYQFDGSSRIKVQTDRIRDPSERIVKYVRHTISVRTVVNGDPSSDLSVEDIRIRLSEDGKGLIFKNLGFGDNLVVNMGGMADIKYGPKTSVLAWEPIGSNRTSEISWSVSTILPDCVPARLFGIASLTYDINCDYDGRGDLTRSISGTIEIALPIAVTELNDPTGTPRQIGDFGIPDTADAYRDWLIVVPPKGFKRTQTWKLSLDKTQVSFRITDTQIPSRNPYPAFAINASGSHRVQWQRAGRDANSFMNTLTMTVDPARGISPESVINIFARMWEYRLRYATFAGVTAAESKLEENEGKKVRGGQPFIQSVMINEDIFGYPVSMSVTWRTIGELVNLLDQSGLFHPWPRSMLSWEAWRTSLTRHMYNNYGNPGNVGLVHYPETETVIDLCQLQPRVQVVPDVPEQDSQQGPQAYLRFKNSKPHPTQSWKKYNMKVLVVRERPVNQSDVIQAPDDDQASPDVEDAKERDDTSKPSHENGPNVTEIDNIITEGGRSRYTVALTGTIERVSYPIPVPRIKTVGGKPVTLINSVTEHEVVGNYFGVPLRRLRFANTYAISCAPGKFDPPPDLSEGIEGFDTNGFVTSKATT